MRLTIVDIAKLAGVSKATVSRVINNNPNGVSIETRNKILNIIDENRFQPSFLARGLATKKTKTIGLIIPDIANPFFPQLVRGIEDYAHKAGYSLFLCNSDNDLKKEKEYVSVLIEKGVDGVILAPSSSTGFNVKNDLLTVNDIPSVLLDRYVINSNYDAGVFVDNVKGAYMAVNQLIHNGNKNIAYISGSILITTSIDRFRGYSKALAENNLNVNNKLIREGDFSIQSGFIATTELIHDKVEFNAIFAENDMMAIGVIKALKKFNIKIPGEVEVIGFDNIELSSIFEPPITTVSQPIYKMGKLSAETIIKLIEKKEIENSILILEPELIIRETTK